MWDFLHDETPYHRELILNKTYNHFKKKHDKVYDDELENHKRKNIFRHNQRFVNIIFHIDVLSGAISK